MTLMREGVLLLLLGSPSRLNGTVAMALGNGINIDHGIAPQSVFLGNLLMIDITRINREAKTKSVCKVTSYW